MTKFEDYKIDKEIQKALTTLGYNAPTLVQEKLFPLLFLNEDTIVKSKTGSGKTAAFSIPIIQMLDWDIRLPQALVLTPTRELALQVREEMFHIGRYKRLKVEPLYGQVSYKAQAKQLAQRTHIVVGTPGRVLDHIKQKTLDVSAIRYVVIDEADEMFAIGFEEQVKEILDAIHSVHTTTLLSATLKPGIEKLAHTYMQQATYIEVEDTPLIIHQTYLYHEDKEEAVYDVLINENPNQCIIFANTKETVDNLYAQLSRKKLLVSKLHGGMDQKKRIQAIKEFKLRYVKYLIATDVAARGIDVDNIELIINYDVPTNNEIYIHRIGRSGRMEKQGKAITLVSEEEKRFFNQIKEMQKDLKEYQLPDEEILKEKEVLLKDLKKPFIKADKNLLFENEIMKLHINAGKKAKIRAMDIVGAICSIEGITNEDIGIIEIIDVATFVEILNQKGDLVLNALQSMKIKGKIRKVNKAKMTNYERDYKKQEKSQESDEYL